MLRGFGFGNGFRVDLLTGGFESSGGFLCDARLSSSSLVWVNLTVLRGFIKSLHCGDQVGADFGRFTRSSCLAALLDVGLQSALDAGVNCGPLRNAADVLLTRLLICHF